ncbi:unnamed protein product [Tuber melanosporum]|uniref:(Perigord truffle) hypothetical protein n=1 Tax=Tuber melanosporum (strain Mel28) TaxID=656061 RepID=D5GCB7_TUBMM|nr:uncharacterized protein GSTUM_00005807001 [Tuber melanosporum]CAZ82160.1 unnamed protein product [Tuber melanosporum]
MTRVGQLEKGKGKAGGNSVGSKNSSGGVLGKEEAPRADTSPYGDGTPTIAGKAHTPPLIPHTRAYPAVLLGWLQKNGGERRVKRKPNVGPKKYWREPATGRMPPGQR